MTTIKTSQEEELDALWKTAWELYPFGGVNDSLTAILGKIKKVQAGAIANAFEDGK